MIATKQIKISDDLILPMQAVTQKFAFLGRTGSGKTYGASKMAEEMLFNGAQIVVIDPMGVWYGLRLAADGKKPSGLDIPVFGGLHGDLPLTPESGALVADILVDRRISAILDVSQMIDAEINRFCTAFADRFFQRMKARPSPVHIFLEECQEFLPQNIMKGEERKLHVFQRIAKQGRNFGIGVSLISQRPQEINKKALNMSEVMFAFQMTGPQERKAIEAWIADKGEDLDIVGQLPKFKIGQPHVWSPQWLQVSKQIHISRKQTYDASATPEFGSSEAARELTPVDVVAIKEAMQEMIAQSEAEDPTALKREIARLKRELNAVQSSKPAREIERVEVPIISDEQIKAMGDYLTDVQGISDELSQFKVDMTSFLTSLLNGKLDMLKSGMLGLSAAITDAKKPSKPPAVNAPARVVNKPLNGQQSAKRESVSPAKVNEGNLPEGENKILSCCAQYPDGVTAKQLTVLTGYKRSTRNTYLQRLSQKGAIEKRGDRIFITETGLSMVEVIPLPTGAALQAYWQSELPQGERAIFDILVNNHPDEVDREALDELTGYSRSTRNTYIQRMIAKELVTVTSKGFIKASDHLFE